MQKNTKTIFYTNLLLLISLCLASLQLASANSEQPSSDLLGKLAISHSSDGKIIIRANAGTTYSNTKIEITNLQSQKTYRTNSRQDGGFAIKVSGEAGDPFKITVNDAAGKASFTNIFSPRIEARLADRGQVRDIEGDYDFAFLLTANEVIKVSTKNDSIVQTIPLVGILEPQGMAFDEDENLYIADTGNHRIVKLLKASGYQIDFEFAKNGSLGVQGTGDGQFQYPRDVAVTQSFTSTPDVYVLDSGNNRVQIFNSKGRYLNQFDGSTTPGGKLNKPLNMINPPAPTISDAGNNAVRHLYMGVDGVVGESFNIRFGHPIGKVTYGDPGMVVPDLKNKELVFFHGDGSIIKRISIAKPSVIAFAYNRNNSIINAQIRVDGYQNLKLDLDTPQKTPTAITKSFIEAFINNDLESMMKLTDNEPNIKQLEQVRDKVLNAFNNITGYEESINGEFAGVKVKFKMGNSEASITFDMMRYRHRWYIANII